jgi:RNA polymerase sigma-70 factor (ECF subfamily)
VVARSDKHVAPRAPRPSHALIRSLPFDGDDATLVAAMRAGRLDAAAAFYDRHLPFVHALVFRLMGPDSEMDDVVHDVFVRAFESLPRLRDPMALRAWVYGIVVRTVAIRFQKRSRQRWLRFLAPEDLPEIVASPVSNELGEALRDVYAILRVMDADERIALVLHCVEGLSHEQAAVAAGTSLSTYRRRLARAQAKFFARASNRPALEHWLTERAR